MESKDEKIAIGELTKAMETIGFKIEEEKIKDIINENDADDN